MSDYPSAKDNLAEDFTNSTAAEDNHPAAHNDANSAINAIQDTLGINPQGDSDTVAARMTAIESTMAASGVGTINHGSTADAARPEGYAVVIWVGSVTPTNAESGDLRIVLED
jgi:hypothetical protein